MTNDTKRWKRVLHDLDLEFRRVTDALDIILEVDRRIFATAPVLEDLLEEMLQGVCRLTKADHAQILLLRGNKLVVVHSTQKEDKGLAFGVDDCVSGVAIKERQSVVVADVKKTYPDLYKAVLGNGATMHSEIVIPIRGVPESVTVGVLNVEWPKRRAFRHVDIEIVEQFALQAGSAMHSARLREALTLTLDLAQMIHSTSHRDAIRQTLQRLATFFAEGSVIQFLMLDAQTESLVIEASTEPATEGIHVMVNGSFCGIVVERKEAVRSDDVRVEFADRFKDTVGDAGGERTHSELAVPIVDAGRVIGVLNVENPAKGAFTDHDKYVLSLLANAGVWYRFHDSARRRATESMAAVGDVAGNLVHILNNGVMPVYLACERVAKLAPTDDSSLPLKQAIGELVTDVEGFRDRVLQLKERYARAIRGNTPINVNELAKTMAPTIVTRDDIEVAYDLDPAIGLLNLPPAIEDVLWNLLSNAKAYMPRKREGIIRIATKLHKGAYTGQAESLEICIADTGIGIAPERHQDIFRLKPGAHGYGLWWVKTFVERCDGTIDLDSDVGRGAAFRLRFPLAAGSMRGLVELEEL